MRHPRGELAERLELVLSRLSRIAGAPERAERALARTARFLPEREREVGRDELGERLARCVQIADELERAEQPLARACGHDNAAPRRLVVQADARAGDLGGERR